MLFSHPDVAERMGDGFECAWQSVRPVPRVTIDFGDGRTLERTLNGNVATFFCTAGGRVFDVAPGVGTPEDYLARLAQASALYQESHLRFYDRAEQDYVAQLEQERELDPQHGFGLDLSATGRFSPARPIAVYHTRCRDLAGLDASEACELLSLVREFNDLSKALIERPLKGALVQLHVDERASVDASALGGGALAEDTRFNREHRDPLVHVILAEQPLAMLEELGPRIYREVLHVELDDPYLGLAPYVLGGELGRN